MSRIFVGFFCVLFSPVEETKLLHGVFLLSFSVKEISRFRAPGWRFLGLAPGAALGELELLWPPEVEAMMAVNFSDFSNSLSQKNKLRCVYLRQVT